MSKTLLALALLAGVVVPVTGRGVPVGQDEKGQDQKPPEAPPAEPAPPKVETVHGLACPGECEICRDAIRNALNYLSEQQRDDGSIPGPKFAARYVKSDDTFVTVFTTILSGLAFLAAGTGPCGQGYGPQIAKIQAYLEPKLEDILRIEKRRIGAGGGPVYTCAYALHFFLHQEERNPGDRNKEIIQSLIRYLTDCIGEEVSSSCWKKGKDLGTVWFVSGVTALVNTTIIALNRARAAGFQVEDKPFDMVKAYYPTILVEKGRYNATFMYDKDNMFPEEPRQGRTIATLLGLKGMGALDEEKYKSVMEYARKNFDKTFTHHTPTLHMVLCSTFIHSLGDEDWKQYIGLNYDKLIARQQDNGSLIKIWKANKTLMMEPNDTAFGPNYATAGFALILQTPLQNLRLYKPPAP